MTPEEQASLRAIIGSLQGQIDRVVDFISIWGAIAIFFAGLLAVGWNWNLIAVAVTAWVYFAFVRWFFRKRSN